MKETRNEIRQARCCGGETPENAAWGKGELMFTEMVDYFEILNLDAFSRETNTKRGKENTVDANIPIRFHPSVGQMFWDSAFEGSSFRK